METIGKRYQILDTLGAGGMGVVYRALDRLTGKEVALKQVKVTPDSLSHTVAGATSPTSLRTSLTHEFQTLAGLRHPHVINVMDYGFDAQDHPFFTMTLMEEPATFRDIAINGSEETKVLMLVEVLQALDYLHRRDIVHRDLKPDNALVDRHHQLRVLDFGLAILQEQFDSGDRDVSGTLAYIAPEILNSGRPTPCSDLYAVGVMAYEVFAGHHPFDLTNITKLLTQIMNEPPDMDEVDASPEIVEVIERLLEKDPDDRFQTAREVIRELQDVVEIGIDLETEEIRESFLQTAPFIGRGEDLTQLVTALQAAKKDGKGSFWLLSGETGVGKTRLLEELRVAGLVRGVLVLRGQGVMNGGVSYQLWRDPIRRLLLASDVDPADAGVLKDIVPDIEQLLGKPATAMLNLEGPERQQRLINAIVNLFLQYEGPILLILEDLQYTEESLKVLEALSLVTEDLSLLVVGSYRHDEQADFVQQFPTANSLHLKRLTPAAIEQISGAMLGEAGHREDILRLLKNETEGNVYFLIEVIRALAEEAGNLEQIEGMDLPSTVAAGGISEVLSRRLDRVPREAYGLLQIAALAGREVDLEIVAKLAPDVELDSWLSICTDCAVLESSDQEWHFSHDKLREATVETVETDQRPALHRRLAVAIEAAYPDAPDWASTLADHWRLAGDTEKELHYEQVAGQYALGMSALGEAIEHLMRALEMLPDDAHIARSDALIMLSEANKYLGNYDAAAKFANDANAIAREIEDQARTADAELELSDVLFQLSNYDDALRHGEQSLASYRELKHGHGTAKALSHLGQIYTQQGDYVKAIELGEESLRISSALDDDAPTTIKTITRLGVTHFSLGDYDDASRFFQQGLELSRENHERRWVANALLNLGTVYSVKGDIEQARAYYEECLEIVRKIGDLRLQAYTLNNMGYDEMLAEAFDRAQMLFEQALGVLKRLGNIYEVANTYANMGQTAEKQEKIDTAREYYMESISQAKSINAYPVILESLIGIARIHADRETAAAYTILILNHEASAGEVKEMAQELQAQLKEELPEDRYAQAEQVASETDLDSLVNALIGHEPVKP